MDALSDVLRSIRLTGGVFLHAELTEPWCLGVRVLPSSCAPFVRSESAIIPYHYVLEGCLRVKVEGKAPLELRAGQVVIFPRNHWHVLGGDLTLPPVPSEDVVQRPSPDDLASIRLGGGGARTNIVCGFLGAEDLQENPVIGDLPPALTLDMSTGAGAEWIQSTFQYAATEVASGRVGSDVVLAKVSELLFVEAVRRYVETVPDQHRGWLAALRDPYVERALSLLHRRPAERWSIDGLSRQVGLSRSALAERFIQTLGVPPMHYLATWRMQLARQELLHGRKSLLEIAELVGYESEAAFARAFKRIVGCSPGSLRRTRGGPGRA